MFDLLSYLVYIGLLFIVVAATHFRNKSSLCKDQYGETVGLNFFTKLSFFLIVVLVGYRFDVGNDWQNYKDTYLDFIDLGYISFGEQRYELGFYYLNLFLAYFYFPYQVLFFISAFISWYFIFTSVPRYLLPYLLFFLFVDEYFFWSMNGVRQFISISIFLYSIKYIYSRNLLSYSICIVFGAIFHNSIWILILVYFIPFSRISGRFGWIIVFLISLYFSQASFVIEFFRIMSFQVAHLLPAVSNYLFYLDSEFYEVQEISGSGMGVIFRNLIFFYLLFLSSSVIRVFPFSRIFFVLFFIGAVINNLFFTFQIIGRVNMYFLIMRDLSLAVSCFYCFKFNRYRLLTIFICIFYFIIFLSAIFGSSNQSSPYRFSF